AVPYWALRKFKDYIRGERQWSEIPEDFQDLLIFDAFLKRGLGHTWDDFLDTPKFVVEGIFRIDRAREEVAAEKQRLNVLRAQDERSGVSVS
ncbi:MAG: hypothetical protein ACTHJX_03820, partial [Terriglobales bacterium]